MDRIYFKSIYTNDPDGHIVELATVGPGFAVDEDVAVARHKFETAAVAGAAAIGHRSRCCSR